MNVLLFGATGMIGQGVLRECLLDDRVTKVIAVLRTPLDFTHPKLHTIVHRDFTDFAALGEEFTSVDACFFCLGITSAGMNEADYRRVTYDIAMAAARTLFELNPEMTFIFVSGAGADSSERGRTMWARVKGATENAILALPFRASYVFRPAFVQPMNGIVSRTGWYNAFYRVLGPIYPVLSRLAPGYTLTTEQIGKAMLQVARTGAPKRVLESRDIRSVTLKK